MHPNVLKYQAFEGQFIDTAPSPLSNWLRGKILEVREEHLIVRFQVRSEMTNPAGLLHGGIMAAIMDDVIGMHLFVLDVKPFHLSVNLHIDYLSSARLGQEVDAKAWIVRRGARIMHAACEVFLAEGGLLAKGTANLIPGG